MTSLITFSLLRLFGGVFKQQQPASHYTTPTRLIHDDKDYPVKYVGLDPLINVTGIATAAKQKINHSLAVATHPSQWIDLAVATHPSQWIDFHGLGGWLVSLSSALGSSAWVHGIATWLSPAGGWILPVVAMMVARIGVNIAVSHVAPMFTPAKTLQAVVSSKNCDKIVALATMNGANSVEIVDRDTSTSVISYKIYHKGIVERAIESYRGKYAQVAD